MKTTARFAYVQARLQAGQGRLPDALSWQSLEASQTLGQYLMLARQGPWADWIEGLDEQADAHRIEQHFLARWRRRVDEVARWLPPRWQAAVRAFGRLGELAYAEDPPQAAARWIADWPGLLPPEAGDSARWRQPADWLLPRLAGATQGRAADATVERTALSRLFRRQAASALAVFAHLALLALDIERLRGGAVRRCLFPPAGGTGGP